MLEAYAATAMTGNFGEGKGIALMTTNDLTNHSLAGLKAGKLEVRPGQSNQLAFYAALAPSGR